MKQTEIGLIPDDWEVKTLGSITTHVDYRGKTPRKTNIGIQLITAKNIRMGYIDYKNNQEFVSPKEYSEIMKRGLPKKGDVLITTEAPAGNVAQIDNENVALAQRVIKYRGNDTLNNNYLCYYFLSEAFQNLLHSLNTGGTVQGIKGSLLHTLPVIVPPLADQQRIAKALSDVDALISTTEKLIQKKKNIKQGAMQKLLTGKKRLPGFAKSTNYKQTELGPIPDDWEVKTLGELFDMKAGGDVDKEHFSYCKSSIYKYKIFSNGLENEGIYGYTDLPKYKGNAITITGRGTVGIAMFREEDFDAVIRLLVLNSKNDNLTNNSYITEEINSCISFPNESTGVPQLTVPQIRDIVIVLPSKEEQTSIANVLSSMDKEIETLNTKLEKYRNLKTAMMQQLLTGKIRLR